MFNIIIGVIVVIGGFIVWATSRGSIPQRHYDDPDLKRIKEQMEAYKEAKAQKKQDK